MPPEDTKKGNRYYGRHQCWRYCLGARRVGAGDADDSRPGAVLRWAGAPEECALDNYAQFLHAGADQCLLGVDWLLIGFQPDCRRLYRWPGLGWPEWRRPRAQSRLCCHHSASGLYDLPADVRRDYAGADLGCFCRTQAFQSVCAVLAALVVTGICPGCALGLGGWRLD